MVPPTLSHALQDTFRIIGYTCLTRTGVAIGPFLPPLSSMLHLHLEKMLDPPLARGRDRLPAIKRGEHPPPQIWTCSCLSRFSSLKTPRSSRGRIAWRYQQYGVRTEYYVSQSHNVLIYSTTARTAHTRRRTSYSGCHFPDNHKQLTWPSW